jgi:glycosyltransferase involved in cell wall biosynthesis
VHDCWLYTGHCYHYAAAGCYKWQSLCEDCPQKFEFPASYLVDRSRQNFLDKKEAFTSVPNMTIVTVSEWMKNEMSNSFLKDCQFQVIHNGIDLNVFSVQDNEQGVRQRYGLGDKRIILGLASIWSKEKGWDDFIEMAKMLNDNELIVLVGVSEKQQEQLPSNIVGIRRTENVQQLAELYSAADVFVNPTWQDNYPTVNLEAIACGTPVVTYRTGGSVEAITDSTGMIVEQGDVAGLLSAAREIMQRGTQFFKDSCRKFALENFDKEERYNDYLKLYDKLLKRSR